MHDPANTARTPPSVVVPQCAANAMTCPYRSPRFAVVSPTALPKETTELICRLARPMARNAAA